MIRSQYPDTDNWCSTIAPAESEFKLRSVFWFNDLLIQIYCFWVYLCCIQIFNLRFFDSVILLSCKCIKRIHRQISRKLTVCCKFYDAVRPFRRNSKKAKRSILKKWYHGFGFTFFFKKSHLASTRKGSVGHLAFLYSISDVRIMNI